MTTTNDKIKAKIIELVPKVLERPFLKPTSEIEYGKTPLNLADVLRAVEEHRNSLNLL